MPVLLDRPAAPAAARRRSGVVPAALALTVAALAALGLTRLDLSLPFGTESVDRSTPPLLQALREVEDFSAATGTFQVVVDLERDVRWVPSLVAGERTTFLATGSVDGVVSFSGLADDAVEVAPDGSVVVRLPSPTLGDPELDLSASRVLDRDRGVVDRVGGMFSDDPTSEREVALLAERKLAGAAEQSRLRETAEENTRDMLTGMLRSLGHDRVEVRFDVPDPR